MVEYLKTLLYDELRNIYKEYLSTLNLSRSTQNTALTEAFYLWRCESKEFFWNIILAEDFEKISKIHLAEILKRNSKGNAVSLTNSYYSHLKRFKEFALGNTETPIHNVNNRIRKTHGARNLIPEPCPNILEHYLVKWNALENYHLQEDALNKLFYQLCPHNKTIEDVLLKCATLNDFYSTNIFSIYPVAKHILNLKIDERLKKGDITLVNEIQHIIIGGKNHNFYSFATKYCSHHNAEDFPIYDSYVEQVLLYFQKEHEFSNFKRKDLKDYKTFKRALIDFRNHYKLAEYSLKQIDQYIWLLGKEYFPKKYK